MKKRVAIRYEKDRAVVEVGLQKKEYGLDDKEFAALESLVDDAIRGDSDFDAHYDGASTTVKIGRL